MVVGDRLPNHLGGAGAAQYRIVIERRVARDDRRLRRVASITIDEEGARPAHGVTEMSNCRGRARDVVPVEVMSHGHHSRPDRYNRPIPLCWPSHAPRYMFAA